MKVVVNSKKEEVEIEYPCLMEGTGSGVIVLFESKEIGVALNDVYGYSIGHHSSSWCMSSFTPFEGSITLSNK